MLVNGSKLRKIISLQRKKLRIWYEARLTRIVFFLTITVILTVTFFYIPYVNLLIPPGKQFFLVILAWYLLFPPKTAHIISFAMVILLLSFIFILLDAFQLAEGFGEVLIILLLFIIINEIRNRK